MHGMKKEQHHTQSSQEQHAEEQGLHDVHGTASQIRHNKI